MTGNDVLLDTCIVTHMQANGELFAHVLRWGNCFDGEICFVVVIKSIKERKRRNGKTRDYYKAQKALQLCQSSFS